MSEENQTPNEIEQPEDQTPSTNEGAVSDDAKWAPPEAVVPGDEPEDASQVEPETSAEAPVDSSLSDADEDVPAVEPVSDVDVRVLESTTAEDDAVPDETLEEALIEEEARIEAVLSQEESSSDDDFDISAALAAVASLDQLTAEEEAVYAEEDYEEYDFQEQGEYVPSQADEDIEPFERTPANEESPTFIAGYSQAATIAHPGMFTLRRGQVASVLPALLLIGVGAWLTFVTTTADTSAPALGGLTILALLGGLLGAALLSHWWASRRWARGSFFISLALLLVSMVAFALVQPNELNLRDGWPLLFSGLGLAILLTGLLTQPRSGGLFAFGLLMIILSGVATSVTASLLPEPVLALAADAWPVALVIGIVMLLVPVIRR